MEDNKAQQEMIMKFQMFEQQIQAIQQQLQAVEQAIIEIGNLNIGLDGLVGKTGEEIFAPMGRGIYVKAKLVSEDITVEIGNKSFVKKTIPETKQIIEKQIEKLGIARDELNSELDKINNELTQTFMESQKKNPKAKEEGCEECGDDCECSHDECGCGEGH